MKNLILGLAIFTCFSGCAQTKTVSMPASFGAAVRFNSICCGTASPDFLKNFIKNFNYENKVTLSAYRKGGCGKEGEFYILFALNNLKQHQQTSFKKELEALVLRANEETRLKNSSKGMVQFLKELNALPLDNCRSELVVWNYN